MTKILLVEDDKALREIYGVRLLAEGYDIVSAGDGEEALTMAMSEHPDLIISDVMMPKISGFEMLDLLRTNPKTRDMKIIVMSALGGEPQRQRGKDLGADRYLVKSQVGIEDVVTVVKEVLNEVKQPTAEPTAAPSPNQSPINPLQATAPNTVVGMAPTKLPDSPQAIPTVMVPPAPTPSVIPDNPKPLLPTIDQPSQTLPPIPVPAPQPAVAPPTSTQTPSFQQTTQAPSMQPESNPNPLPPNVDPVENSQSLSAPRAVGSARIIQPTGESLSPKVDINSLLSKEEPAGTSPNIATAPITPTLPTPESQINMNNNEATSQQQPNPTPTSSDLQIGQDGVINLDSIPDQSSSSNNIFPVN